MRLRQCRLPAPVSSGKRPGLPSEDNCDDLASEPWQRYCAFQSCSQPPPPTTPSCYVNPTTTKRWHLRPQVRSQRHPQISPQISPHILITPHYCPDLSRRYLCSTRLWVAHTTRVSNPSLSAGALFVHMRMRIVYRPWMSMVLI